MPYRPPFPIPEDIHAEPFCLCIQVPNDPVWKRVVAGLLDELNQWYNWQRDEGHSGRECAQVWRELYAQIDWSTMSCCCDSINPPQYRYTSGGVLQVSVDGGVTYTDAPNADVRNNSAKFPPIEGDDGEDKRCAAASGAANLVREQIGDQLTDDMGRYTLNQLIGDWTHTMIDTSNPFIALVTVVANQIFALLISAVRAALTDSVYHLFACALFCTMADDGSFNDAQWAAARAKITEDISGIAGVFLEHLVYLLGKVGTTNLVRSAPDVDGDCSDCACGDFCDTSSWFIPGDGGSINEGTRTASFTEITAVLLGDGKYYVVFTSGDDNECCTLSVAADNSGSISVVSGAPNVSGYIPCGVAWEGVNTGVGREALGFGSFDMNGFLYRGDSVFVLAVDTTIT